MFSQSSGSTSVTPTVRVTTVSARARPNSLPTLPQGSSLPTSTVLDTPTITNIVLSTLEGVQTGVPTRTTPTLTPTTLKNIEQLFETQSVQPPEVHFNQAGFVPPLIEISKVEEQLVASSASANTSTIISVDSKAWGGGVTTLTTVTPLPVASINSSRPSSNCSSTGYSPSSSPMPVPNLIRCTPRRTGGRRPQIDESLSPEEEERRVLRRERNKQAAARCRKRRLDQTLTLEWETENLEGHRESLQKEIQMLQQQREELEFILAAHKNSCKVTNKPQIQNIVIKEEPIDFDKYGAPIIPPKVSKPAASKPLRPTSLNIKASGEPELGVSIETPSNALRGFGLNFDSMMEGGTGLTPVALQPITPMTPVISSSSHNSKCGSQLKSGSMEMVTPDSHPPKLVSL